MGRRNSVHKGLRAWAPRHSPLLSSGAIPLAAPTDSYPSPILTHYPLPVWIQLESFLLISIFVFFFFFLKIVFIYF